MASIKDVFSNKVYNAWRVLCESREQRVSDRRETAALLETAERVVDRTDARIRLVSGYRRKLQGAIRNSLDYASTLVDEIPGALEVSSRTFRSDPHVNAFFTNVDELRTVFSHSFELRDFLEDYNSGDLTETCALICMQKIERKVLGMELSGDLIKRDVQQTAVSFFDHHILSPAATESEARKRLKQYFFDGLVTAALGRIMRLRLARLDLETRQHELKARLRESESLSGKQGSKQQAGIATPDEAAEIRAELAAIENALQTTRTPAPQICMEEVITVLRQPDDHVRVRKTLLKLNKMGIKISTSSKEASNELELAEVTIDEELPRVVTLVKFPTDELLPRDGVFQRARHHVHH